VKKEGESNPRPQRRMGGTVKIPISFYIIWYNLRGGDLVVEDPQTG